MKSSATVTPLKEVARDDEIVGQSEKLGRDGLAAQQFSPLLPQLDEVASQQSLFQMAVLEELKALKVGFQQLDCRLERIEDSNKVNGDKISKIEEGLTITMTRTVSSSPGGIRRIESGFRNRKELGWEIAEKMYSLRSSNKKSNFYHVNKTMDEEVEFFAPIIARCPNFNVLIGHVMINSLTLSVHRVSDTLKIQEWGEEECRKVGSSLALFLRKRKTGATAMEAWRLHFVQTKRLFDEIEGFEEFMSVFANNLLRDSIYGMVLRVSVGASLSTIDGESESLPPKFAKNSRTTSQQLTIFLFSFSSPHPSVPPVALTHCQRSRIYSSYQSTTKMG